MAEGDPNIPPRRARDDGDTSITCEFCRCTLSRRGAMIRRSAEAKAWLDQEDAIERLTKQGAAKDSKIAELEAAIVELRKRRDPEPEPGGGGDGDGW